MVLFVDLEDETEPPEQSPIARWNSLPYQESNNKSAAVLRSLGLGSSLGVASLMLPSIVKMNASDDGRVNPNRNSMTEALGCYPIITSIASHIDLNTLDALSRTCRQIRVNLLQFRTHLLTSTLHCENEDVELDTQLTFRYRARAADWYYVDTPRDLHGTGKVGDCARDMVGGCRRCGRIVCRNCTIKSPPPNLLRHRHRRICKPCSKAPLAQLIPLSPNNDAPPNPTNLEQLICSCPNTVWLCQPCGRSLRSADNEYESIWKWRTRYLPSLGGLGAGIGEGDRGVPCGRGGECVAAREVEQEVDCDAEDARGIDIRSRGGSPSSSSSSNSHSHAQSNHAHNGFGSSSAVFGSPSYNGSSSSFGSSNISFGSPPHHGPSHGGVNTPSREGPGYMRHEIEGIGGVVKKKLVTMVRVGACVTEWGDEKAQGKFLVREVEGRSRSWCGWCWRVVPGVKDVIE